MKRAFAGLLVLAFVLSGCAQTPTNTADSIGYVAANGALVLKDADQRGNPIEIIGNLIDGTPRTPRNN